MVDPLRFVLVFIAMFAVDVLFALYTRRTSSGQSIQAGLAAAVLLLFSAYVITSYVEHFAYLIAAMLGSFLGTVGMIEYDKRKGAGGGATR